MKEEVYFEKHCFMCGKWHMHKKNKDGITTSHDNDDKKLPNSIM